jgi:hypothetical protein
VARPFAFAAKGRAAEQMNVFGHDDVAHRGKSVAVAGFAENLDEGVSGANRAQKW